MLISTTKLKNNLSKYLLLAQTEDIYITKNKKVICKLTKPFQDKIATANSLFGILPNTTTFEEIKNEKINKI